MLWLNIILKRNSSPIIFVKACNPTDEAHTNNFDPVFTRKKNNIFLEQKDDHHK
jgi:hypothetical protein